MTDTGKKGPEINIFDTLATVLIMIGQDIRGRSTGFLFVPQAKADEAAQHLFKEKSETDTINTYELGFGTQFARWYLRDEEQPTGMQTFGRFPQV